MSKLKLQIQEPLEKDILSMTCEYLQMKGYFFWRNNSTGVQRTGKDGRMFWANSKYAMSGVSDIICFDKTNTGIPIFIECKRPSTKLSPDQEIFKKRIEEIGCEYLVVRRLEDLQIAGL